MSKIELSPDVLLKMQQITQANIERNNDKYKQPYFQQKKAKKNISSSNKKQKRKFNNTLNFYKRNRRLRPNSSISENSYVVVKAMKKIKDGICKNDELIELVDKCKQEIKKKNDIALIAFKDRIVVNEKAELQYIEQKKILNQIKFTIKKKYIAWLTQYKKEHKVCNTPTKTQ